tara:strand:+ start:546 stop:1097 length:552 start_codon:yes stop_codon:yes gene_type:complete
MGIPTLIKTLTAADDSSLSFVDGTDDVVLDSTYDEYMFVMTDINVANDQVQFQFNASTDGGSNYNVTKTSTYFYARHGEDGSSGSVQYHTSYDIAEGTGYQTINYYLGNGADESTAGILHLFGPANTTYAKHFYSTMVGIRHDDHLNNGYAGGYLNTTSAVDAIAFATSNGNFDGVIQLYGIA